MPGARPVPILDRSPTDHEPVQHVARERIGGLDGLRAVAVLAVVAYHLWPDTVPAGFLGVDLFMVLSGFLITGLLIDERSADSRVRLGAFWARRFRRLVPALLATVTGVAIWVRLTGHEVLEPVVRGQGLASLLYVGNWKLIDDGTSYAALTEPKSPLLHLWSLAIEEQFYVVWPLVVVVVLLLAHGRHRPLVTLAATGAAVSVALMSIWYEPGHDPLRLYFGTDTRAFAFLIGALAVLVLRRAPMQRIGVGAFVLLLLAFVAGDNSDVLYQGGFALFAVMAAVAVVAVTQPGPLARLLDQAPLRVIGRVSYGIYLWHWPVIVLVNEDTTPFGGIGLVTIRLALTAALTTVSWFFIEQPYRRASPRRAVQFAVIGFAVAALSLLTLPRTSPLAYAGVDVSKAPTPAVSGAPGAARSVMIIGDSGMYDVAPALTAGFTTSGARVVDTSYAGQALTRPPGVREAWAEHVDEFRPDLVVVMLGAWDYDFVAAEGEAAYVAVIDATVKVLTAHGADVLWLSVLPGDAVVPGKRVPATELDRFFSVLPERYPGAVEFLDISDTLDEDGGDRLRKPDRWHLCQDGAAAIARAVLDRAGISSTAWLTGNWRADRRYDDPPGGCPG